MTERRNKPERALFYVLDGLALRPEPDVYKWSEWRKTATRTVARTRIGNLLVSTVFIGQDLSDGPINTDGPAKLFQTRIFDGKDYLEHDIWCATWEQAEAQHRQVVTFARAHALTA